MNRTQRLRDDCRGQGVVEYVLLIALIVIVVVAALLLSGQSVANVFRGVNEAVGGDVTAAAPSVTPDETPTTAASPTPGVTPSATPAKTATPTASSWNWKQSYLAGDVVVYRDVTYRCIYPVEAHSASETPPRQPKYWEIVIKPAPASPF